MNLYSFSILQKFRENKESIYRLPFVWKKIVKMSNNTLSLLFLFFFFALHFCMSSISSNFLSSEKIRENKECAAADLLLSCLDFTQKKFKCCFSLSICSLSEIYSLKIIPWNRFHEIFVKESRKDNSSGIPPYRLLIVLWFHEKKLHSFFSFSKNFVKTFIPFFVFQKFRENTLCSLKVDNTDK